MQITIGNLKAAGAMGGLRQLGQEPTDMVASTRARFCQVYEALLTRQRRDVRMLPGVKQQVQALGDGNDADAIKRLAAKFAINE